jgi:fructose transport system ATP-binding protein
VAPPPVILIGDGMPHPFEIADRLHIHRSGRRAAVVTLEAQATPPPR